MAAVMTCLVLFTSKASTACHCCDQHLSAKFWVCLCNASMLLLMQSIACTRLLLLCVVSAYLACDTGRREALVLAVLIEDPAHHAAACTDLWAGNVNVRTHH